MSKESSSKAIPAPEVNVKPLDYKETFAVRVHVIRAEHEETMLTRTVPTDRNARLSRNLPSASPLAHLQMSMV